MLVLLEQPAILTICCWITIIKWTIKSYHKCVEIQLVEKFKWKIKISLRTSNKCKDISTNDKSLQGMRNVWLCSFLFCNFLDSDWRGSTIIMLKLVELPPSATFMKKKFNFHFDLWSKLYKSINRFKQSIKKILAGGWMSANHKHYFIS